MVRTRAVKKKRTGISTTSSSSSTGLLGGTRGLGVASRAFRPGVASGSFISSGVETRTGADGLAFKVNGNVGESRMIGPSFDIP
jgi:hypothetical protein